MHSRKMSGKELTRTSHEGARSQSGDPAGARRLLIEVSFSTLGLSETDMSATRYPSATQNRKKEERKHEKRRGAIIRKA